MYDDASTDGTAEVAERYGAEVVRGDVNQGCSAGKNILAKKTNADWLHFHDSDDELLPNFVGLARAWIEDGNFDVVLFPYEERFEDTCQPRVVRSFDRDQVHRDIRSYTIREQINPFCGLYRRQAYLKAGGYDDDPDVLFNEDVAFHIRMAFAGLSFAVENETAIVNHRSANSMSGANRLKCLRAHYHVMRKTAERADASPYAGEIAQRLWLTAAGLASELDWDTADAAAVLASRLAGPSAAPSSVVFKTLCRLSPSFALRVREGLIRSLKPHLRTGYPGWRASIGRT